MFISEIVPRHVSVGEEGFHHICKWALGVCLFACAVCSMAAKANGAALSATDLRAARAMASASCFREQRANDVNKRITDDQIRAYCDFFSAELLLPTTTMSDLEAALAAYEKGGHDAKFAVLLKGRSIYEVGSLCGEKAIP